MRGLLFAAVSCVMLLHFVGCDRPQSEAPSSPPTNPPVTQPASVPQAAAPQAATEPDTDESAPAAPAELNRPPATSQARFAGPLFGKSVVRTRIFGEYKPTASLFMGERQNRYNRPYYHQGVDILAPVGTKLVAPDDGAVVISGIYHPRGYGRVTLIRVRAGAGHVYVLYAHLSKALVRRGARVQRGEVVALTGKSGNAGDLPDSEAHVHVEVWTREKVGTGLSNRLDPLKYFTDVAVPK